MSGVVARRRHRCGGSYRAPALQQERNILEGGEEPIKLGRVQVLRTKTKRVFRAIYLSLKALTIQMKHNKRLQVLSDKTCK